MKKYNTDHLYLPNSICFVNDRFLGNCDSSVTITGPMVQMYNIGNELKRRGWSVSYVASTDRYIKTLNSVEDNSMRVFYYKRSRYGEILSFLRLWLLLKQANADFYYQRGRSPLTGIVALFSKVNKRKMIWASAGEDGTELNKYTRGQLRKRSLVKRIVLYPLFWFYDRLYHFGIKSADILLVQTEYQRERLKKNFDLDAVVLKSGHIVPKKSKLIKRKPPIVLWIGSIKKVKQPEVFLQLVHELRHEYAEFYFVGNLVDVNYSNQIDECKKNVKNFLYLRQIPFAKVTDLYAKCSVLVNTTLDGYEGLPNAFIQAWLNAIPVVSLFSNPDNVISDHALGFQTQNKYELIRKVQLLIRNETLRNRLGENARSYAVSNYAISSIVDQFQKEIFILRNEI